MNGMSKFMDHFTLKALLFAAEVCEEHGLEPEGAWVKFFTMGFI